MDKVPYISIKLIGGGLYVIPFSEIEGFLNELLEADIGEKWEVEKVGMTKKEFNNLPEFQGH